MRRLVLALYGLIFVAEVVNWAIVPLLPRFTDALELTKVETGAVLAATSVATVAVAAPAGLLADRIGPRPLTVGSGLLTAAACAGQGLSVDFWTLLASRAAFGVAFATVWTAGIAWLSHSVEPGRRTIALGATVTTAGIAGVAAPALAGLLADRFGVLVPFAVVGVAALAVTGALALAGPGVRVPIERRPFRETLGLARRSRAVLGALAVTALGGVTAGVVNLLVPLQLDANGVSEGMIGVAFSAGAAVFIVASALVARLGDRAARLRVGGAAALVLAGVLGLVVSSTATPVVVVFLLLRAPLLATLFTISFPLGARGARRVGVGEGAVMGLLNVVWGVATVVGPLAGGALAQAGGEQAAFGALVGCALAVGSWALLLRPAKTAPAERTASPAAGG